MALDRPWIPRLGDVCIDQRQFLAWKMQHQPNDIG